MHRSLPPLIASLLLLVCTAQPSSATCPRPPNPGSDGRLVVPQIAELTSRAGVLSVVLRLQADFGAAGTSGNPVLCYAYEGTDSNGRPVAGMAAPTLRLKQGDLLTVDLYNELLVPMDPGGGDCHAQTPLGSSGPANPPTVYGDVTPGHARLFIKNEAHAPIFNTNLHFHGLAISPKPPGDDVITTVAPARRCADDPPSHVQYRIRIPSTEPAGLYWYHPHPHGESMPQVLAGLSGAIIVESARSVHSTAALKEQILIVRDSFLPDEKYVPANPSPSVAAVPMRHPLGAAMPGHARQAGGARHRHNPPPATTPIDANCATPTPATTAGVEARPLTINGAAVDDGDDNTPSIAVAPGERQIWRVLNASANTYLDLTMVDGPVRRDPSDHTPGMPLQVLARDGLTLDRDAGPGEREPYAYQHIVVPPAGRVELLIEGPPSGGQRSLRTLWACTGPGGDYDPARDLVRLVAPESTSPAAAAVRAVDRASVRVEQDAGQRFQELAAPLQRLPRIDRRRTIEFNSYDFADGSTTFLVNEVRDPNLALLKPYDPTTLAPDIRVKFGTMEEWTIQNWTEEVHAFHIHQLHFAMVDWDQVPHDTAGRYPILLDTVNVPARTVDKVTGEITPGVVRIRLAFNEPEFKGLFVFHCHVLEHEDNGMMGKIRVED